MVGWAPNRLVVLPDDVAGCEGVAPPKRPLPPDGVVGLGVPEPPKILLPPAGAVDCAAPEPNRVLAPDVAGVELPNMPPLLAGREPAAPNALGVEAPDGVCCPPNRLPPPPLMPLLPPNKLPAIAPNCAVGAAELTGVLFLLLSSSFFGWLPKLQLDVPPVPPKVMPPPELGVVAPLPNRLFCCPPEVAGVDPKRLLPPDVLEGVCEPKRLDAGFAALLPKREGVLLPLEAGAPKENLGGSDIVGGCAQ